VKAPSPVLPPGPFDPRLRYRAGGSLGLGEDDAPSSRRAVLVSGPWTGTRYVPGWLWNLGAICATLLVMVSQSIYRKNADAVEVEVPRGSVSWLRESLLLLYGVSAATLHLTVRAHLDDRAWLAELSDAKHRLAQLGEALDQLGWTDDRAASTCHLTVSRDVLRDATKGALLDAKERLTSLRNSAQEGEPRAGEVRRLMTEVSDLGQLFDLVETDSHAEAMPATA
jgi:hypothetical protein